MKRLTLLAVALVMVLGMAASASAAPEVAISGNLLVNAVWKDNWAFKAKNKTDNNHEGFTVYERADLYFTITANENLKGVLGLRSDKGQWGKGSFANDAPGGGVSGTNGYGLSIRDAYIDFNWPGSAVNVKAGVMPVSLPAAVGGGSMIQNARAGAAFVSTAFTDNVSLLAGWARLNNGKTATAGSRTNVDAWIVALPLTFEGFSMSPYAVFAPLGKDVNAIGGLRTLSPGNATNADTSVKSAYWVGSDFTMDLFDPFVLKADFAYGKVTGESSSANRSGWLFDTALEYKGFDFMTPELFFVYTSGEDGNATKGNGSSERMPVLQGDWAVGSFFFGGTAITGDDMDTEESQNGFWTVGLSLKDIQSFAEGLTHDIHIMYIQGTNDKQSYDATATNNDLTYGRSLTEKDSLWEVSTTTAYKIYDELTAYVQLGYINLDASTAVWGTDNKGGDAWKVATGVVYQF